MCRNRTHYSNTRPKLLEVNCGRTFQQNKGLLTMSLPVVSRSALCGVPHKLRTRTPRWSLELRFTTSVESRCPLNQTTWHYDGNRRRRRHSRNERTSSSLTADDTPERNTELESSPFMRPAGSRAFEGCSSLSAPGPVVEPPHLSLS